MAKKFKISSIFKGLGWIALIVCAVFCGKLLGDVLISAFFKTDIYAGLKEEALLDDKAQILNDYNSGNITYNGLTANDASKALVIACNKLDNLDYYYVERNGNVANPVGDQKLKATFEKDGTNITSMELSSGIKRVANKLVVNSGEKTVQVYKGTLSADGTTGVFDSNFKNFTFDDYKKEYGINPDSSISHLVTSKTIESASIEKAGNKTTFKLKLHPIKSVIGYSIQVAVNSGLKRPEFNYVNFNFTIDNNFNLLGYDVDEEYVVEYGIKVTCHSTITAVTRFEK